MDARTLIRSLGEVLTGEAVSSNPYRPPVLLESQYQGLLGAWEDTQAENWGALCRIYPILHVHTQFRLQSERGLPQDLLLKSYLDELQTVQETGGWDAAVLVDLSEAH